MKIIVIGDVHGRTYWKNINPDNYDKIVFVGDYCDTRDDISAFDVYSNLEDIIEFKKQYIEKVILLIGNHDLMYFFLNDPYYSCSGFMPSLSVEQHELLNTNWSLFQPAFQIDNYLITHAGVSIDWYEKHKAAIETFQQAYGSATLADTFIAMWNKEDLRRILAEVGQLRDGYRGDVGGIFWADRRETADNSLPGFNQIVGHTPIDRFELFGNPDSNTTIRYVDCQGFRTDFYEFEV